MSERALTPTGSSGRQRRPLLLEVLPSRARQVLFWRYYRRRRHLFADLYRRAALRYAPGCCMYDLIPGDVISDNVALTGVHEEALSRRLRALGRLGGLMVDVGANMGYFALLWGQANPGNKVVAIEASPRNLTTLRNNVARNRLSDRVEIIAKAAGKSAGTLPFVTGPADQTGWGGLATALTDQAIEVGVIRLDEVLHDAARIAFLKIDIEGADSWALMGCERLLREQRIAEIWFEENRPRMKDLGIRQGEATEFLLDCGYRSVPVTRPDAEVVEWRAQPFRR